MKVIWSPRAIRRATEISRHIAKHKGPKTAERWVDAVFDKADQIPPFPGRAAEVPECLRPDLRQVFHGVYRIIFRFDSDTIQVLTVRHGAQQLPDDDLPEDIRSG